MRTLPAELQIAMDGGSYDPYFLVTIKDKYDDSTIYSSPITGYKLNGITFEFTVQTSTYLDLSLFRSRVTFTRGVTISGVNYTIDTSEFRIVDMSWTGVFQNFSCNLIPKEYYTATGDGTYQEVIEAFCAYFDKTAVFLDPSAAWLSYQFLPTGKHLTVANAQKFFTLLKQKYFIFATDNGNNEILFYTGFDQATAPDYEVDSYKFKVNFSENLKRRFMWRDENSTVHYSTTEQFSSITFANDSTINAICVLENGVILAGETSSGNLYRSTNYGVTWELITTFASPGFNGCDIVYLGSGIVLVSTFSTINVPCIQRSTDYGLTWENVYSPTPYTFNKFCNLGEGIIIAGQYGKIYRSTDYGLSWTFIQQLDTPYLRTMTICHLGSGIILSHYAGDLYRSDDYGLTWTFIQTLDSTYIRSILNLGNGTALATTQPSAYYYRTTNYGLTWTLIYTGPSAAASACSLVETKDGVLLGFSTDGVYKSSNMGTNWAKVRGFAGLDAVWMRNEKVLTDYVDTTYAQIYIYDHTSADTYILHNLGFLQSTANAPALAEQPSPPKFNPFPMHLKYQSSDYIRVNLQPTTEFYDITRADITEVLDLSRSSLAWHIVIEATQWLTTTEGGQLPGTIEAAAPYTPLVTTNFNNNLDATVNNLQALADAIDDLVLGTSGSTTIPLLTADPASPADAEMWLLRTAAGAHADGEAMGTLGMTYTGDVGISSPIQLSINDAGTTRRLTFS